MPKALRAVDLTLSTIRSLRNVKLIKTDLLYSLYALRMKFIYSFTSTEVELVLHTA